MELVDFRIMKLEDGKVYEGVYGINVAKVNEIIRLPKLTELPGAPDFVEGVFDLRGTVIPIINLANWMGVEVPTNYKIKPRVIITEFNNVLIGFVVHEAKRIRRVSWKNIEPAHFSSNYGNLDRNKITGTTRIEGDHVLLILDLESIVEELGFYKPEVTSERQGVKFDGLALVLDDSAIARKIVRETLENMGFTVVEAIDGEAGIERLENLYEAYGDRLNHELKVIISDVEMPQMDGFHFATKVKEDKRFAKIPIIFNSSISDQFSAERGREAGGEAYLVKYDANSFYEEIARVVGGKQ
ncbi:chemotaxis protein CheV [Helicobacter monodelphidis]|uniref:chemotaxis protein CheV n=1 Tax=Helicobacter sp. 15-1451 TaxID=2004995 RepID=UPI0015EBACB8|nr:chemotaxis protein CheV [Helicobacter sp. 15-1451]